MSTLAESQPGPPSRESDVPLLLSHDPLCLWGDLSVPGVHAVQPGWVSLSRLVFLCPAVPKSVPGAQ